ncbi:hypothetical protein [Paenibacillus planticolens]|uniref:Uncharacterized protein n=1 Tax=Paenibacillus planticolens TaxID=2654976 RepID=A0ABX1ZNU3_9BACL|nr:hypothetical protein [Paenibacillus planticolens]NOV00285.1 hypothetical protein [Paenibacillus planticolens]
MKKNNAIALAIMLLFIAGAAGILSSFDWGIESPAAVNQSKGNAQGKLLYGFIFYEETASDLFQIK